MHFVPVLVLLAEVNGLSCWSEARKGTRLKEQRKGSLRQRQVGKLIGMSTKWASLCVLF